MKTFTLMIEGREIAEGVLFENGFVATMDFKRKEGVTTYSTLGRFEESLFHYPDHRIVWRGEQLPLDE